MALAVLTIKKDNSLRFGSATFDFHFLKMNQYVSVILCKIPSNNPSLLKACIWSFSVVMFSSKYYNISIMKLYLLFVVVELHLLVFFQSKINNLFMNYLLQLPLNLFKLTINEY